MSLRKQKPSKETNDPHLNNKETNDQTLKDPKQKRPPVKISTAVASKFVVFASLVLIVPMSLFFYILLNYQSTMYAAIAAVVSVNIVVFAYIVAAFTEADDE